MAIEEIQDSNKSSGETVNNKENSEPLISKFEELRMRTNECKTSEESNKLDREIFETSREFGQGLEMLRNDLTNMIDTLLSLSANGKRVTKYPNNPEYPEIVASANSRYALILESLKEDIAFIDSFLGGKKEGK